MSIEYEIKARVDEEEFYNLNNFLSFLNARGKGTVNQTDIYFSTGNEGELLRIRHETSGGEILNTSITYKGLKLSEETKTRVEHECIVSDGVAVADIFEALGFKKLTMVNKKRQGFMIGELRIYKDVVEGLGQFVELEIVNEDRDYMIPNAPLKFDADKFLLDFAKALGLNDLVTKSYLELKMEQGDNVAESIEE